MITPELAGELLKRNTNNRKLKLRAIANYARDMRAGKWDADASDLKVARTGELIDGQNRLMACIEAGVPFPTLLRTGLSADTKDHVDQGVRRTVADSFAMAGVTNANSVAAAVLLRARYEVGLAKGNAPWQDRRINLTHDEALAYLAAHPAIEKMTRDAQSMHSTGPTIPRTIYIAGLSMAAESNEKEAQHFADRFIHGEVSGTGDPLLAFTRYLSLVKGGTASQRLSRPSAERHLLAFLRAWNAWRNEEKLDRIVVRDSDVLVPAM